MISGPNYNVRTIPEEQFFTMSRSGVPTGDVLPLPEGMQGWNNAALYGEDVLACTSGSDLFIIAEDTKVGYALFHYVYSTDNGNEYKMSYTLPYRILQTERRQTIMANPNSLGELARQTANNRGLQAMNLGGAPMEAVGDGLATTVDVRRLQREALAKAYVFGYIMGSAPATTLAMSKKKQKEGEETYNIVAKESKPSRCLSVLMALPKRCVSKAGNMASPSDIMSGMVDFNTTSTDEMWYQAFPVNAAISYISALGGKLPEYAPNVSDARRQWDPQDILSGKPDVTFVRVHATENKNRTGKSQDRFRFSLKTTSTRRSLYTPNNHVCLRALEHMPLKCTTEQEAYNLNEAAFGAWRYRKPKTETKDVLSKAIAECPGQIWRKQYTINGQQVEGIGSAFFMAANEEENEAGESIMKHQLAYYPWYQTGSLRPTTPSRVDQIVKRTLRPAEGDKKERMVTSPVLWKDNASHPMFKGYAKFVDEVLSQGYLREDKLKAMGGRAGKTRRAVQGLSSDQMTSLKQFLRDASVEADIQTVQDEAADRAVLLES